MLRTRSLRVLRSTYCHVKPIASVHSEPGSSSYVFLYIQTLMYRKGVLPAAGSPTATLLRLHISHSAYSNIK